MIIDVNDVQVHVIFPLPSGCIVDFRADRTLDATDIERLKRLIDLLLPRE